MANRLSTILFTLEQDICGGHASLLHGHAGSLGPPLGTLLVVGFAVAVTLACIAAAAIMLIRPGERNHDHPKYRILRADR